MGRGNAGLPGIDADDLDAVASCEALAQVPDGGDGGSRAHLHYHGRVVHVREKSLEEAFLAGGSVGNP